MPYHCEHQMRCQWGSTVMKNSFPSSPTCSLAVRCQGHTPKEAESKWATLLSLFIDHEKTEAWRLTGHGALVSRRGWKPWHPASQPCAGYPGLWRARSMILWVPLTDSLLSHVDLDLGRALISQWGGTGQKGCWWQERGEGNLERNQSESLPHCG